MAGDLNARDARLAGWLQEAHTKESELEASLTQHISLTRKDSYKKRLQAHLKETRDHKRRVERRIKQLGGELEAPGPLPGVPSAVNEVVGKTVSAAKGQLGMARAAVTEQVETHLRNAQEELREEHVEIALYSRIEGFASEVGDRETASLAKAIRREEERMAKFLDAELGRLVKELVRKEIPREQRASATGRRTSRSSASSRRTSTRASSGGSRSRSTGSRAASGSRSSSSRSSSSRSSGSRSSGTGSSSSRSSSSGSRSSGSGSSSSRSSGSRSSGSGSSSSRSSSSRSTGSRSGGGRSGTSSRRSSS